MSIRTERIAGEIQKSLADLFQRDFSHLYQGLLTVTTVRVSPDLRHCKAYISLISNVVSKEQTLVRIHEETASIRMAMARSLRLQYVPELRFYLDDTQEEVAHIERLFQEVRRREAKQDDQP